MKRINQKGIVSLLVISFLITLIFPTFGQTVSTKHKKNGKTHTISKTRKGNSFEIEYKGDIEISEDDSDIIRISRGGYIEISKTNFGSKRAINIEASGGGLIKEYYEGRKKLEWEPTGKKWLAEILPEIVRSTGIAAKSRVDRIYKKEGVKGVLNEIEIIDGSYVKSIYGNLLLDHSALNNQELINTIEVLAEEINSDYYLSNILKERTDRFLKNDNTAKAYFKAVSSVNSDYYMTVILKQVAQSNALSEVQLKALLDASEDISSDYYMASLYSEILEKQKMTSALLSSILSSASNINSDYYHSNILKEIATDKALSKQSLDALMNAAEDINSDNYQMSVYGAIMENQLSSDQLQTFIRNISNSISSDYYLTETLKKIISKQTLDDSAMEALIKASTNINSDYYQAVFLKSAVQSQTPSDKILIAVIKASENIASDHYMTDVLLDIAPEVKQANAEVQNQFRSTAKQIGSDSYYGKVSRAID